ncbi:MAG: hypothetical protein A2782_02925 [Candidatus Blackburnbacteria bacterium RIFCSPHIGHO2_01_FULL_43_15b]|uniref:Polysaccharide biosynthesis protein C-terminal domain-containing protein n=1 Tax=Candidatus Blackburnbacteria bacterium RIFCSPHIGHO2_01_FULL_43_15b TaxID=1797513 RepID=A0A1G1V335_9BACT|nr:MAG: hypothetical protein A2782_02925 [Candidatus Blackburnbacteria bacterium RIFCSPHIGHO2_01_FULL_43_15b]
MKTLINYFKASFKNPLLMGSFVMVVGTNLYSTGQFLYHSIALRVLGEAYYGDLAAIISLLGIVGIFQLAFNLTIVKFVAGHNRKEELQNFSSWINWWSILIGLGMGLVLLSMSPLLAAFLKLHQPSSIYLLPVIVVLGTVLSANRSILQGLLRFNQLVASLMSEMLLKIMLTIVLVWLSYAIFGAMVALLVGVLVSYGITRVFLKDVIVRKRGERPSIAPLIMFSLPVFIQGAALTSMYSADILLVKHFFSAYESGVYASVAALGRIAFFVSTPISAVMFPMISRRHAESQPYKDILLLSILGTFILAAATVLAFRFSPQIFLALFSGHVLKESVGLLWWFSAFAGFLSVASLLVQFYLSVGKVKMTWFFAIAALGQAIAIWFIHPDLLRVIQISLVVTALLAFSLSLYLLYHQRWLYHKR